MSHSPGLHSRPRMLALDADGTLVDSQGTLRPAVRNAVAAARAGGMLVVVCTGRRYRTVRPLLEALDLSGPVVVHNGVIVKDARSGETLAGNFLPHPLYRPALAIMRGIAPPLVYVDRYFEGVDVYHEPPGRCHEFQAEYLSSNSDVVHEVDSLADAPAESIIMVSLMADGESLLDVRSAIERELGESVQTNFIMNKNYRGHILEITRAGVSKWEALHDIARDEEIEPSEIAAIGDDTNDTEMIARAGIGIAMANAVEEVKAVADFVTDSNDDDGVARAIERLLGSSTEHPDPASES